MSLFKVKLQEAYSRFTLVYIYPKQFKLDVFLVYVFALLYQLQEIYKSKPIDYNVQAYWMYWRLHHLVVQVTELLHQVLGDALAAVGLVVGHTVLGVEANAAHAPLLLCGVLQQPIVLSQVVDRVPVRTMDPGCSKFQSGFTCYGGSVRKKDEILNFDKRRKVNVWIKVYFNFYYSIFCFAQKYSRLCLLIHNVFK